MIIREMRHSDCTALLSESRLARLACCRDNIPYVVPIYFHYVSNRIVSFSMPGQKIEWMRANSHVCLEIEHFIDKRRWKCLLVNGLFEELTGDDQRESAWTALQTDNDWWEPGSLKPGPQVVTSDRSHIFYAVNIESMSGREAIDE
ncbi:pyridoxamine 5'-phosphate oxidase family protein [Rhizobium sp. KVB221]|uniref:Pyridoxamine 5'-phosphate oxidase family protein n=1 Tax=Rhizobium setariae TaxID=2801340 RepID=A0A936YVF5_9HYPH|nr:pyridoxamine 5'-phosphate oxidase family protein [Rhizobium setariae]MBL0373620.1 pyridoxamine 5'-phosphate oxidase family protein [Rhizobium setariae]